MKCPKCGYEWRERVKKPKRCVRCGRWFIKIKYGNAAYMHEVARKIKRFEPQCEWKYIGGCQGSLQVAHVNGDIHNNDLANLLKLCRSHHFLMDNKAIDPKHPVMKPFRTENGKRRYLHTLKKQYETERAKNHAATL